MATPINVEDKLKHYSEFVNIFISMMHISNQAVMRNRFKIVHVNSKDSTSTLSTRPRPTSAIVFPLDVFVDVNVGVIHQLLLAGSPKIFIQNCGRKRQFSSCLRSVEFVLGKRLLHITFSVRTMRQLAHRAAVSLHETLVC